MTRKVRGDSVLAGLPQERQDELYARVESSTLAEAQEWLASHYDLNVSQDTLSRWAGRRRQEDMSFARHKKLMEIAAARRNAEQFAQAFGDLGAIHQSNIGLFGQALLAAQLGEDQESAGFFAKAMHDLMDGVAKMKRADAAVAAADTAREKFEFDAAKAVLEHMESLQSVRSQSGLSDEEKAARVRELVFGREPGKEAA